MTDEILTPERILDAAEEVLRRFGPAKTTVVDVARALGVSHGSVYRHFPSKAALRAAVTERWLARMTEPLVIVAAENGPAAERLQRWLELLVTIKHRKASAETELFATYIELFTETREVVQAHVEHLVEMTTHIITDGITQGEFAPRDPAVAGRAVINATSRFHNPAHMAEWSDPQIDAEFADVWSLIRWGLSSRPEQL